MEVPVFLLNKLLIYFHTFYINIYTAVFQLDPFTHSMTPLLQIVEVRPSMSVTKITVQGFGSQLLIVLSLAVVYLAQVQIFNKEKIILGKIKQSIKPIVEQLPYIFYNSFISCSLYLLIFLSLTMFKWQLRLALASFSLLFNY